MKTINLSPFRTSSLDSDINTPWVAIMGNPNCGKTALFNRLTGLHHKVGNYPGITVEKKTGKLRGEKILLRDFPGSYSLNARSADERIVEDMVQSWRISTNRPMAAIIVLDATNLSRSIYLALQVLDWDVPSIIVLNMMDEARKKGLAINIEQLKSRLQVNDVIPASARYGQGIIDIFEAIKSIKQTKTFQKSEPRLIVKQEALDIINPLVKFVKKHEERLKHHPLVESLRLLSNDRYIQYLIPYLNTDDFAELQNILQEVRLKCHEHKIDYYNLEQDSRFYFIDMMVEDSVGSRSVLTKSKSEKLDSVLTHKIWGPLILFGILAFIFNAIFTWAQYPMELIDQGIQSISQKLIVLLPESTLKDLLIEGVIAGVGSILIFFPQIIILIFFIALLEDSGYMARMAFMMDRIMHKIGLHGRSVLPLLSGFACAIPAIMSARTVENWRDRLQTILMIPLMSCSARLPVYVILIAAFIPDKTVLGFLSLQALVLMGMYFLGMFTAVIISIIIKKIKKRNVEHSLIMELPPYRLPMLSSIGWQVYERGKIFLMNAGTIILAISIVLWFLASFPQPNNPENLSPRQKIEQSYAGQIGHAIEPIIKPLGYDWKIGVGLVTSFAAREVIISTLSTLYNLEENEHHRVSLIDAMRNDRDANGKHVFSVLVALSLMVFFAYAAQCMATFAIIKRETNSWRWPILMVIYMTVLAYSASLIVYQGGQLLGLS